jgi:tRNA modification GTPase
MSDTIAAISTAFGEAAISVIRLSGSQAKEIAGQIFEGRVPVTDLEPRFQHYGRIVDADGATVDSVLLTVFRKPASYTGEDVVEISGHGGILVTRRIYELLLTKGARAAEPGEFTQRAFLNGKMDLTQAEAVMDLIHAQSELALKSATQQLEGRLGKEAEILREDLIGLVAHLEAYIDFPEEDIDPDTGSAMEARMEGLIGRLQGLLDTAEHGRILRSGARTVICGEPNVGKSSLLNLLTGVDRAIVSAQAGTTRDTIEEMLHIHGLPFRLVDTAGLREHTSDQIEATGMERTRRELAQADVILEVVDGSRPMSEARRVELPAGAAGRAVLILNKADENIHSSWTAEAGGLALSCKTGEGLETLRAAMKEKVWNGAAGDHGQMVAINARHQRCFQEAQQAMTRALEAFRNQLAPEFVSVDVREALQAVGEVTGRVDVEEILGVIFSQFCIGK